MHCLCDGEGGGGEKGWSKGWVAGRGLMHMGTLDVGRADVSTLLGLECMHDQ